MNADEATAPDHARAARRLARGGSFNFAGLAFYGAANFVLVAIVSRGLGTTRAGAFLTAIALFSVLMRVIALGSDTGLVRFLSQWIALERVAELRRLWIAALVPITVLGIAVGAGLAAAARPVARLIGDDRFAGTIAAELRVLAAFLPIAVVYHALDSASRGFGTVKATVLIEKLGRVSLQLTLVSIAVATDATPAWLAASWAAPFAVALLAMAAWTAARHRRVVTTAVANPTGSAIDDVVPAPSTRKIARDFWVFCGPRAPAGVFQAAMLWSDALFIGGFASTREVGIYVAATRLLVVATLMQLAVGQALQPLVSAALARSDRAVARDVFQSAAAWTTLVTWPAILGVMTFSPVVLSRVYGQAYSAASTTLVILGIGWLVAIASGPVDNVLLMAGKSWYTTVNIGIASAVNVALNAVLIPRYGMEGAGTAWAVSLVLNNLLPLVQVHRTLGISPFGPMLGRVMVPVAGFAAVLLAARVGLGQTLPGMLVGGVGGVAALAGLAGRDRRGLRIDDLVAGVRRRGAVPATSDAVVVESAG